MSLFGHKKSAEDPGVGQYAKVDVKDAGAAASPGSKSGTPRAGRSLFGGSSKPGTPKAGSSKPGTPKVVFGAPKASGAPKEAAPAKPTPTEEQKRADQVAYKPKKEKKMSRGQKQREKRRRGEDAQQPALASAPSGEAPHKAAKLVVLSDRSRLKVSGGAKSEGGKGGKGAKRGRAVSEARDEGGFGDNGDNGDILGLPSGGFEEGGGGKKTKKAAAKKANAKGHADGGDSLASMVSAYKAKLMVGGAGNQEGKKFTEASSRWFD